jgi:hypothetical protein
LVGQAPLFAVDKVNIPSFWHDPVHCFQHRYRVVQYIIAATICTCQLLKPIIKLTNRPIDPFLKGAISRNRYGKLRFNLTIALAGERGQARNRMQSMRNRKIDRSLGIECMEEKRKFEEQRQTTNVKEAKRRRRESETECHGKLRLQHRYSAQHRDAS